MKAFNNKRLLAILLLGFTSGLPFVLRGSTLQAWLNSVGVSKLAIGNILLITGLPYILKVIWAPLMDSYGFLSYGRRKPWIVSMQLGLVLTLFVIAQLEPTGNIRIFAMVAVLLAFFSASQDISITAYQTELLHPEERGLGVSYYIFAYRLAILFSGGGALIFADYFGWTLTYELMALVMFLSMLLTLFTPNVKDVTPPSHNPLKLTLEAWGNVWQRDKILLVLLFIFFYKFGDALALQLMTVFLMNDLGFSLTELGITYKNVSFIATILGTFIGGSLLLRLDIFKALLWFGLAQAFSNLMFVWLSLSAKSFVLMSSAIFIENFCTGLSTAALLSFMMSLCDHRYSATQFALFSIVASAATSLLGPVAAIMIDALGWTQFFLWAVVLSFPGLLFLLLLMKEKRGYAPITA